MGELGIDCCRAIPALHAFTGNDYTCILWYWKSQSIQLFYEIRKTFKQLLLHFNSFNSSTLTSSMKTFESIELFVCAMYGVKCSNTNEPRYKKLCSSRKASELQKPPHIREALLYHCKRVSYVTAVVKKSLVNSPDVPSPDNHGWKIKFHSLT